MTRGEAERILLAIDGIRANLESLRVIVEMSIVEPEELPPINIGICPHEQVTDLATYAGNVSMCKQCGETL